MFLNNFTCKFPKYLQIYFMLYLLQAWNQPLLQRALVGSVTQSCLILCKPMNRSTPGLPVHQQLPELTQTRIHRVGDAIQPSHPLSYPLLLLPPIPPSNRVFSNESTLRMRWPKYWSFSFSIIPSKEIPGLISYPYMTGKTIALTRRTVLAK